MSDSNSLNAAAARPAVAKGAALTLFTKHYGFCTQASELPSEVDRNFLVTGGAGADDTYVFKFFNQASPLSEIQTQLRVLKVAHDAEKNHGQRLSFRVPRVVLPKLSGAGDNVDEQLPIFDAPLLMHDVDGQKVWAVVLQYIPGIVQSKCGVLPDTWYRRLGAVLGVVDCEALERQKEIDGGAFGRQPERHRQNFSWDLLTANHIIEARKAALEDEADRAMVSSCAAKVDFRLFRSLRHGWIHNDANDNNIVICNAEKLCGLGNSEQATIALIDFRDAAYAPIVAELAIAGAYAILDAPGLSARVARLVQLVMGYCSELALTEEELELLFDLVLLRLSQSLCNGAFRASIDPANASYLTCDTRRVREALRELTHCDHRFVTLHLRNAAGLSKPWQLCVQRASFDALPSNLFASPLDFDQFRAGGYKVMDFCRFSRSGVYAAEHHVADPRVLEIGRYNEVRSIYKQHDMFASGAGDEERNIHLGIDLGAQSGTEVFCIARGRIHSAVDNTGKGNYGPTLIVEHDFENSNSRTHWYSLYGHLSRSSLRGKAPGDCLDRGALVGWIGDSTENGGWPSHVHLQITLDLLDKFQTGGDFPGVCSARDRTVFLSICPDPTVLLRDYLSNAFGPEILPAIATEQPIAVQMLQNRHACIGANLSVSYQTPIAMLTAYETYMVDIDGRHFLDMVNNPMHVGHNNERVNRAIFSQFERLNTNTRYLYENLGSYANALLACLPSSDCVTMSTASSRPHFAVCYFVNSGSEANDLALRIARCEAAKHGRKGTLVLSGGYHGHTTALIDVSPYKFAGKGGSGCPPNVAVAPVPDSYRGMFRGPHCAQAYVQELEKAADRLGSQFGVFLFEAISGCGGQIVPPKNYVRNAIRAAHARGAICIADEVQHGVGRTGHFCAFESVQLEDDESDGIELPDIVTFGKPIGNGFPLGVVVTTQALADSFASNGMEFFATFGGNPVACAAGLAVLGELKEKNLMAHASQLGAYLLSGLERLQANHACLGNVRGKGLFLGVEIVHAVAEPESTTPRPHRVLARYIVNRMKDQYSVLLSTDGPEENVIKIKPPMTVSMRDAGYFLASLDRVLGEGPVALAG
ncbi:Ethanolamine-phosphate phospho-lyase [Porphyridium purpureum]|uniref:Ethanolamine-phosphate phospho-lyase n=1 Tax=Porphyridium purpureum TaxID=35688 RepID=A0A5J4YKH4_PORPP|nr:Ethanolamine-phosphate phospho-lyase [Porphyridium purpureum]|eukprot:POR8107..scf244_11